jgi:hypothetical protein
VTLQEAAEQADKQVVCPRPNGKDLGAHRHQKMNM